MSKKKVLILGASGLVGQQLLGRLLKDETIESVISLVRNPMKVSHPKLYQVTTQFEKLADQRGNFKVDVVFCCLGTTIKNAGTKSAFRRCDYYYVVEAAKLAKEYRVDHFLVISALGANPDSTFFYKQIKGEMERDIYLYGPAKITIVRPSLLIGARDEKRPFEELCLKVLKPFRPFFYGPLKKYRPISASKIAEEMIRQFKGRKKEKNNDDHIEVITMVK